MHNQPSGAAYDVVLLLHVACVVVGIVTVATAAATARRLTRLVRTGAPLPEPLVRYFRPGVNWAGRTIYGIPVFGFALLGMSHGSYALTDSWVLSGVVLFVVAAVACEGWLWPAERQVQAGVQGCPQEGGDSVGGEQRALGSLGRQSAVMERAAVVALVLLVAGTVVMVAQP